MSDNGVSITTNQELHTQGLVLTDGKWQASGVSRFLNAQSYSATNPTIWHFGFITMKPSGWNTATDASDGVYTGAFFSLNSQRTPFQLRCTVVNAGVVQATQQLSVTPNALWHNFSVVGNSTGSQWNFYYDGLLVSSLAGTPSALGTVVSPYNTTARPRLSLRYLGTSISGTIGVLVDALYYRIDRNTPLSLFISP